MVYDIKLIKILTTEICQIIFEIKAPNLIILEVPLLLYLRAYNFGLYYLLSH